jgi:bifunctional isochorismate lyase / aryl carrier protein
MRRKPYAPVADRTQRTHAWLAAVRDAVAPRPLLRLDPPRCALLVIDMQRYFADPRGRSFLPATDDAIPEIRALLDAWRGLGGTVIFTRHAHEGAHDLGMLGKFFTEHIREGLPEAEIIPALAPSAGEPVLRKRTYDAFHGTPLESILAERACTQVLVTGVLTHICCETTARSAFCRGFEVYVAADATASSSEERHLGSLLSMADCVAIVMSAAEILQRCAPRRSS